MVLKPADCKTEGLAAFHLGSETRVMLASDTAFWPKERELRVPCVAGRSGSALDPFLRQTIRRVTLVPLSAALFL